MELNTKILNKNMEIIKLSQQVDRLTSDNVNLKHEIGQHQDEIVRICNSGFVEELTIPIWIKVLIIDTQETLGKISEYLHKKNEDTQSIDSLGQDLCKITRFIDGHNSKVTKV